MFKGFCVWLSHVKVFEYQRNLYGVGIELIRMVSHRGQLIIRQPVTVTKY